MCTRLSAQSPAKHRTDPVGDVGSFRCQPAGRAESAGLHGRERAQGSHGPVGLLLAPAVVLVLESHDLDHEVDAVPALPILGARPDDEVGKTWTVFRIGLEQRLFESERHGLEFPPQDPEGRPQRAERLALRVGFHRNRTVHGDDRLGMAGEAGPGGRTVLQAHDTHEEVGRTHRTSADHGPRNLGDDVEVRTFAAGDAMIVHAPDGAADEPLRPVALRPGPRRGPHPVVDPVHLPHAPIGEDEILQLTAGRDLEPPCGTPDPIPPFLRIRGFGIGIPVEPGMHHELEQSLPQLRGAVRVPRAVAVRHGVRFREPRVVRLDRKHREEPVVGRFHGRPGFRAPTAVRNPGALVDAACGVGHVRAGQAAPVVEVPEAAGHVDRRSADLAPAVARQPQALRVRPHQDLEDGRPEMLAPVSAGHPAKGLFLFVRQRRCVDEITVDKVKRHRRRLLVAGSIDPGAVGLHAGASATSRPSLLEDSRSYLGTVQDA